MNHMIHHVLYLGSRVLTILLWLEVITSHLQYTRQKHSISTLIMRMTLWLEVLTSHPQLSQL